MAGVHGVHAQAGVACWRSRVTRIARALLALRGVPLPLLLIPAQQLRTAGVWRWRTWHCEGDDPQFRVVAPRLRPGWYAIALVLRIRERAHGVAKLYVDSGQGISEAQCVRIPVRSGERTVYYVHFAQPVRALRFDPIESRHEIQVCAVSLVRISQQYALARMLDTLAERHPAFLGQAAHFVCEQLRREQDAHASDVCDLVARAYRQVHELPAPFASQPALFAGYDEWIRRREAPALDALRVRAHALVHGADAPRFSLILTTYQTAPELLEACIDAVFAQSYPHWELCVADDASTSAVVARLLDARARDEPRVRVCMRAKRGHISQATNSALALASSEYVVFIDHDDLIAPDALLAFAEVLSMHPDAVLIYSDEDKLDADGRRCEPHFKPDWNPDLFRSQNYIGHLCAIRRDAVQRLGGMRAGFEGSQDYDLLLRLSEQIEREQIVHVPAVLYHWRKAPGSSAADQGAKPYAHEAGVAALREHYARSGVDARVDGGPIATTYHTRRRLAAPPTVTLIVPTRDNLTTLQPCLDGLLNRTDYPGMEIMVVDNASTQPRVREYLARCAARGDITLRRDERAFNFSAINNRAVAQVHTDIVVLLNDDVEPINSDWLREMVSHAVRPEIGCVGAKLLYRDDTVQHGGVVLGIGGVAGHSHKYYPASAPGYFGRLQLVQNYSAVTAACLAVRRSLYLAAGGLDEEHLPIAFNDVDFCLRVQAAGYRNLWTPHALLYHHESKSRGAEDTPEKQARFRDEQAFMQQRWGAWLTTDPCYSPNLSLRIEDFSIAV